MKKVVFLAIILSLIMLHNHVWAKDITLIKRGLVKEKKRAREIEQKLKEKRRKIKDIRETKRHLIWELDSLNRKIHAETRKLESLNRGLKETQDKIKALDTKIHRLWTDTQRTKTHLHQRLRSYYKLSQIASWNMLFSAQTPTNFIRCLKYLEYIMRYDIAILKDYQCDLSSLRMAQIDLRNEKRRLFDLKLEIKKRQDRIKKERKRQLALLNDIKVKENLYLAAIQDLKNASRELQSTIERLRKETEDARRRQISRFRPTKVTGFASLKGKLPPPVKGEIVTFYGKEKHPRFNTFIFHKGIRIRAPYGSEIRSIYHGKVIYSDWFKGYGNIIIIDHGDSYYSLSCHASRLFKKVGDRIKQGEVIGLVGDTGPFYGSGLYFEIRHGGKSVNPLNWLAQSELVRVRR